MQMHLRHFFELVLPQVERNADIVEHLTKMVLKRDPELLVEFFACTEVAWECPEPQWASCLLLLLSGETHLMAQQLPVTNQKIPKKVILQTVGCTHE